MLYHRELKRTRQLPGPWLPDVRGKIEKEEAYDGSRLQRIEAIT